MAKTSVNLLRPASIQLPPKRSRSDWLSWMLLLFLLLLFTPSRSWSNGWSTAQYLSHRRNFRVHRRGQWCKPTYHSQHRDWDCWNPKCLHEAFAPDHHPEDLGSPSCMQEAPKRPKLEHGHSLEYRVHMMSKGPIGVAADRFSKQVILNQYLLRWDLGNTLSKHFTTTGKT